MQSSDVLRAYYGRVVPAIPELFNMAHAICGNYDLAAYALQVALMEMWIGESHGGIGFREGLRNILKKVASEEALEMRTETPEFTWNGLADSRGDPVLDQLAAENVETRRAIALRYGCDLPVSKAAKLMERPTGEVRELLERFVRKLRRKLGVSEQRKAESMILRSVRQAFAATDESMPSLSAIYRSFVQEAAETQRPKHLAAKIVRRGLCVVLALVCALTFWFAAALIHPTTQTPPEISLPVDE